MNTSRRQFLNSSLASAAGVAGLAGGLPLVHAASRRRRLKIAAVTTTYFKYSHSQHIVDRFLEGYGWDGRHHRPDMDVVSLYVEQVGENDLSRERLKRYPGMKHAETIEEALTLGSGKLAVDGVLLIGEHGDYPVNERGQKLYPRYEYFQKIVDVFRRTGRTAPVFNDKHLSWNWKWAREMYDTARKMDFGFMAGSSLPVARRMPAIDLPWEAKIRESLVMRPGGIDGGDIHTIEALQAIIERRHHGESGIQWVEALRGERFWNAMAAGSWEKGGWDPQLMETALTRSNMLKVVRKNYGVVLPRPADIKRMASNSYAYRFAYRDGTRATVLGLQGKPGDWTLLDVRDADERKAHSIKGSRHIYVGELNGMGGVDEAPGLGHRVSVYDLQGNRVCIFGSEEEGEGPGQFIAPHGIAVDSKGDVYVSEVSFTIRGSKMDPPKVLRSFSKYARQ